MSKQPLDYRGIPQGDEAKPRVRWQTILSCSLLGMALLSGLVALAWPQHRSELISAAITLGITGVLIYFMNPYVRT